MPALGDDVQICIENHSSDLRVYAVCRAVEGKLK
jgi:hypothetical protein